MSSNLPKKQLQGSASNAQHPRLGLRLTAAGGAVSAGSVVERPETHLPGLKGSPQWEQSHTHAPVTTSQQGDIFSQEGDDSLPGAIKSVVKEALKHQITPPSLRTLHLTYHCSAYVNLVILS